MLASSFVLNLGAIITSGSLPFDLITRSFQPQFFNRLQPIGFYLTVPLNPLHGLTV